MRSARGTASNQVCKLRENILVQPLFERDDQLRQLRCIDPLPLAKFLMRRFDVDIGIGAFEAHQKPMLALPAIFALPNAANHIIG